MKNIILKSILMAGITLSFAQAMDDFDYFQQSQPIYNSQFQQPQYRALGNYALEALEKMQTLQTLEEIDDKNSLYYNPVFVGVLAGIKGGYSDQYREFIQCKDKTNPTIESLQAAIEPLKNIQTIFEQGYDLSNLVSTGDSPLESVQKSLEQQKLQKETKLDEINQQYVKLQTIFKLTGLSYQHENYQGQKITIQINNILDFDENERLYNEFQEDAQLLQSDRDAGKVLGIMQMIKWDKNLKQLYPQVQKQYADNQENFQPNLKLKQDSTKQQPFQQQQAFQSKFLKQEEPSQQQQLQSKFLKKEEPSQQQQEFQSKFLKKK